MTRQSRLSAYCDEDAQTATRSSSRESSFVLEGITCRSPSAQPRTVAPQRDSRDGTIPSDGKIGEGGGCSSVCGLASVTGFFFVCLVVAELAARGDIEVSSPEAAGTVG